MKSFWLSFTDDSRPAGQQFMGVCVVDVSDIDAELAGLQLMQVQPNWIAAAVKKAWAEQCNPGGQVMAVELPDGDDTSRQLPRNRLLSMVDMQAMKLDVGPVDWDD